MGGIALTLLLPIVSSCGNDTTGPSTALSQAQLITAAEAMFRHTVVVSLDLPRAANGASGTETILTCNGGGSVSTTAFISGTSEPEAGQADRDYETGTTYDQCVEGSGAGEIAINTSANATGVIGEFTYQAFGNGDVEVEGFLIGRVEIETGTATQNCRVAYQLLGLGSAEGGSTTFNVAGDICEAGFAFEVVVSD